MDLVKIISIFLKQFKSYDEFKFFKISDEFLQEQSKCCHFENNGDIEKIATAVLQQITQSSFDVIQFMEKLNTILHPPFYIFERFELYAVKTALLLFASKVKIK